MRKTLAAMFAVVMLLFVVNSYTLADKDAVEYFEHMKICAISNYYTNVGKWFSMMNNFMEDGHIITKPDQSDLKALHHFILDNVTDTVQYAADASAEFWATVYQIDELEDKAPDFETFADIINLLDEEQTEQENNISTVNGHFSKLYKTAFEDQRFSESEYQDFLAGICALNDIMQEVLMMDSAQDPLLGGSVSKAQPAPSISPVVTATKAPAVTAAPKKNASDILAEQEKWENKFKTATKERMKEYYDTALDDFSLTLNAETGNIQAMNIYFTWSVNNSKERTRKMLEMFSEDLSATLHEKYPELQIVSMTVFWKVPKLFESGYAVKYQYYSEGDKMYLRKKIGPLYGHD